MSYKELLEEYDSNPSYYDKEWKLLLDYYKNWSTVSHVGISFIKDFINVGIIIKDYDSINHFCDVINIPRLNSLEERIAYFMLMDDSI